MPETLDPVPAYIEARIRQPPPQGAPVVPYSTPVVSFGDVRKARVATLGLNPSSREFVERGKLLNGTSQRLETLESLRVSDLSSSSPDVIRRVFDACNGYFQQKPFGKPYREWFDDFKDIFQRTKLEASFYDGTACHLDLVQWATAVKWNDVKPADQQRLLDADLPFLKRQLLREHIRFLLLNGAGVVTRYCKMNVPVLEKKATITVTADIDLKLFVGRTLLGAKVIGWNKNIQSEPDFINDPNLKALYIEALIKAINEEMGAG
jgi:hypothetical protein